RLLQTRDLLADHLLEARDGHKVPIEPFDDLGQARLDRGPERREQLACLGVESEKAPSDAKIAVVFCCSHVGESSNRMRRASAPIGMLDVFASLASVHQ